MIWTSKRLYRTENEWVESAAPSIFCPVSCSFTQPNTCACWTRKRMTHHMDALSTRRRTPISAAGDDDARADAIRGIHDVLRQHRSRPRPLGGEDRWRVSA